MEPSRATQAQCTGHAATGPKMVLPVHHGCARARPQQRP